MNDWDCSGNPVVAIEQAESQYGIEPPFHPSFSYPEQPSAVVAVQAPNPTYDTLRRLLRRLTLDDDRFGTANWSPLGRLVRPGDTVVIKPNWIREGHLYRPDEWEHIVTHPSLIRAVADYVFLALGRTGKVIVADGPQTDSDFSSIERRCGLEQLRQYYSAQKLAFEILDLRKDQWRSEDEVIVGRVTLPGDPAGYTEVDLSANSEFISYGLNGQFYGADYDMDETRRFHSEGRHCYRLCKTPMAADVFINLPKMKTHKKTGVTLSLKNLVGINGYRNCLPHHTIGTPASGGDEFPTSSPKNRLQSLGIVGFKRLLTLNGGIGNRSSRLFKAVGRTVFGPTSKVVRSGNWHGNDTTWRMVLDLNKVLWHFDASGARRTKPIRYFTVVDGIVGSEGDGPVSGNAVASGVLIGGANPVAVDTVAATVMGFDFRRIPVIQRAWSSVQMPLTSFEPDEIRIHSNVDAWNGRFNDFERADHFGYSPHFGWVGKIEQSKSGLRKKA